MEDSSKWVGTELDPGRLTSSLRDTGYDLNTAVADIVDNSIAAGANRIYIYLERSFLTGIVFFVADDGEGMTPEGITNALTYGSAKREDPSSLGKFGLGLKTASTAFSTQVRVTSRKTAEESFVTGILDLDEVAKRNQLGINVLADADNDDLKRLSAREISVGTIVTWSNIDRLITKQYKIDSAKDNAVKKSAAAVKEHLEMVFHRFLDFEDGRARNVEIYLNDERLSPWNPFGFGAELIVEKDLLIGLPNGETHKMRYRNFILPRSEEISAEAGPEASKRARLSNDTQGVYVFRENRMIHGPSWLDLFKKEFHYTLNRVELSFGFELDDAFKIDVKKSQITLDKEFADALEKQLTVVRREAQQRYRKGKQKTITGKGTQKLHNESNASILKASPEVTQGVKFIAATEDPSLATISNKYGEIRVPFKASEWFVETVPSLEDGLLYEPMMMGGKVGIRLNESHPFYHKVYLPNSTNKIVVIALDSLLWSLAQAEYNSTTDQIKSILEDIRYDVSKALKRLVSDLPEPNLDNLTDE